MAKLEQAGFYDATIKSARVEGETCQLKTTAEAQEGTCYPTGWLLNKDGTENTELVDYLAELTGWDKESTDDLCKLLVGKSVRVNVKCKTSNGKEYWNAFFVTKSGKKEANPEDGFAAQAAWLAARGKALPAKPATKEPDLSIPEGNIPF
jgi:hypothetical protein